MVGRQGYRLCVWNGLPSECRGPKGEGCPDRDHRLNEGDLALGVHFSNGGIDFKSYRNFPECMTQAVGTNVMNACFRVDAIKGFSRLPPEQQKVVRSEFPRILGGGTHYDRKKASRAAERGRKKKAVLARMMLRERHKVETEALKAKHAEEVAALQNRGPNRAELATLRAQHRKDAAAVKVRHNQETAALRDVLRASDGTADGDGGAGQEEEDGFEVVEEVDVHEAERRKLARARQSGTLVDVDGDHGGAGTSTAPVTPDQPQVVPAPGGGSRGAARAQSSQAKRKLEMEPRTLGDKEKKPRIGSLVKEEAPWQAARGVGAPGVQRPHRSKGAGGRGAGAAGHAAVVDLT